MYFPTLHLEPGLVAYHRRFPFDDDPTRGKRRPCLVLERRRGEVLARGIFSRDREGRAQITTADASCLDHDSFLGGAVVVCRLSDIDQVIGEAGPWFDPFDDFVHP